MSEARSLAERPVHLGLGAAAEPQPPFTGTAWYADYGARAAADGAEGRLVSHHTFAASWESWEMHPAGSEVVICTDGRMTLIQELPDGDRRTVDLETGEYAINPAGVWHTADVSGRCTAIFITAGKDTQHRPR